MSISKTLDVSPLDIEIIKEFSNPYASFSAIARKLRISREQVRRRIQRILFSKGRFCLRVNYYRLGLSVLVICWKRYKTKVSSNEENIAELNNRLNKLTYITSQITSFNENGFYKLIFALPPFEWIEIYNDFIEYLIKRYYGSNTVFFSMLSTVPIYPIPYSEYIKDPWSNFITKLDNEIPNENLILSVKERNSKVILDEIDLKILEELEKNPLSSISAIAKNIGISAQLAHYHLNNHLRKVIISRHLRFSLSENKGLRGFMMICFNKRKYMFKFISIMYKLPHTISIHIDILKPRILLCYQVPFNEYKSFINALAELVEVDIVSKILNLGIMSNYLVTRYIISYHKCYKNGKWIIDPVVKEWAEEKGLLPRGERVGTL